AGQEGSADGTGSDARFMSPIGVAVDGGGNVYVTDSIPSCTIRRVTPEGVVTTIGGSAWEQGRDDGTGSDARFMSPRGVAVDSEGNLYVADADYNHVIRKGTPGIVPPPPA